MHDGFGVHTAEGVLGGALGTLFMRGATRISRRLPSRLLPTRPRQDPADVLVKKLEELRGRPLPWAVHEGVAQGLHWAYGIAWGGLFGLVTTHVRIRTIGDAAKAGAALGGAVWAIEDVCVLPLLRLTPPVHRQGGRHVAASLLEHIAYGVASALPIYMADRVTRRRPWYERVLTAIGW
jgi:hypothetical protein